MVLPILVCREVEAGPPKAPAHEIMGAEPQGFTPFPCSCAAVWIFFRKTSMDRQ